MEALIHLSADYKTLSSVQEIVRFMENSKFASKNSTNVNTIHLYTVLTQSRKQKNLFFLITKIFRSQFSQKFDFPTTALES